MAPIARSVEPDDDTTVFTVTGEVTAAEIIDAIMDFLLTAPTQLVIWDLGNGSLHKIPPRDLRSIVERAGPYTVARAGGRTAIVVHNDLDFGLSRMFEAFAELGEVPFEIRVFRDITGAKEWLRQ
jgi:hypothetical protein